MCQRWINKWITRTTLRGKKPKIKESGTTRHSILNMTGKSNQLDNVFSKEGINDIINSKIIPSDLTDNYNQALTFKRITENNYTVLTKKNIYKWWQS